MTSKMKIRKGDRVKVIAGRSKGKVGEKVRIRECRPLSKTKSWEVLVEAAKA